MKRRAPELLGLVLGLVVGVVGAFGQTPVLQVAPESVQFTMADGSVPASQQVTVTATPATMAFSAGVNYLIGQPTDWLMVRPVPGAVVTGLVLTVAPVSTMQVGTYSAQVVVFATATANVVTTVNVTLRVAPSSGRVTAWTPRMVFVTDQVPMQSLVVSAALPSTFTAVAETANGVEWLSVGPAVGEGITATFRVSVDMFMLSNSPVGKYEGVVKVFGGGGAVNVPVVFFRGVPADLGTPEPAAAVLVEMAGRGPLLRNLILQMPTAAGFTLSNVRTLTGGDWLSVLPESGQVTTNGNVLITLNLGAVSAGLHVGSFTLTGAGETRVVPVAMVVSAVVSTTGLRFVPVEPCRLMETRAEYNFQGRAGAFGPPLLGARHVRRIRPQDSTVCAIPASAKAYSLNATMVPAGEWNFFSTGVRLTPAGEPQVMLTPTVFSTSGKVFANSAIVKAGVSGAVDVGAQEATDVLLDVNGYFVEENRADALAYYPIAPCRVVETRAVYRQPPGPFGPPTLAAGERRTFPMRASPHCEIAANTRAYVISLTAVPDGPLAFLSLVPTGGPAPLISSLNSMDGRVVSNQVIVPAGTNGSIDARSYGRTDVILDITGYFAPSSGSGLLYYALSGCLMGDWPLGREETRTIAPDGCGSIVASAKAYALNAIASPTTPMPFLTVFPTGQARPGTSFLNAFEGQSVTNSVIVSTGTNGAVDLFAYRATRVTVMAVGYFGM